MKKKLFTLACMLCCFNVAAQTPNDKHWVASWGAAQTLLMEQPQPWVKPPPPEALPKNPAPSPIPPVPSELRDQTVRMIVRTSIAGDKVRLQFSNAQGTQPVLLGGVHVARTTGNGAIDAGTDRAVMFGGKAAVTLFPGALAVSDPVDLPVPALTEVAVSIFLPAATPTLTKHELGLNTTYIIAGNALANAAVGKADTNRSYFWLDGLEVLTAQRSGTVIAFGDSITDGFATTANMHHDWPSLLMARLQQASAGPGVVNVGISGNRVVRNGAGASALLRFDRDVLARSGVRWLVLLEGINDINFTALPSVPDEQKATAAQIIEGLSQLVDRAHANGIKVMGATLTPMGGLWLFNKDTEAMRQAVNTWVRTGGKYDALVDFDAVTRDPNKPEQLKPDYDSGDHIHPNDAGNAAMAAAIDTKVFNH